MKLFLIIYFFLTPLFVLQVTLQAQTPSPEPEREWRPILLEKGRNKYSPALYLEILEDPEGKLTYQDVRRPERAKEWYKNKQEIPNFAFSHSVYWFRFKLKNPLNERKKLVLELNWSLTDYIEVFIQKQTGKPEIIETGDRRPFATRQIKHRNFLFNLEPAPGGTLEVYLRIYSHDGLHEPIPLTLRKSEEFAAEDSIRHFFLGVYLGILAVMALYNLFIYFSLRDKSYLYYGLLLLGFSSWLAHYTGLAYFYLYPDSPWWNNQGLPFFGAFFLFQFAFFARSYLDMTRYSLKLDMMFRGMAALMFLSMIIALGGSYSISAVLNLLGMFWGPACGIIAGFISLKHGHSPARHFLFAFFMSFCGGIILALKIFGFIPSNFFTEHSIFVGVLSGIILLSLGLADRINVMRQEKAQARKELVQSQQKALVAQQELTRSYARFVPTQFLEQLGKESIKDVSLGDAVEREMTILFSDIRSFTTLSEDMSPRDNFMFINEFLKAVGPAIRNQGGFIDKYIGDAVMALFPDKPDSALQAALDMTDALDEFNRERQSRGLFPIHIGIGIHTGRLMLGTIGDSERMDGTVIADAVNLASRLEGLTKTCEQKIIISEDAMRGLENPARFNSRELGEVPIKGKSESVSVFALRH